MYHTNSPQHSSLQDQQYSSTSWEWEPEVDFSDGIPYLSDPQASSLLRGDTDKVLEKANYEDAHRRSKTLRSLHLIVSHFRL